MRLYKYKSYSQYLQNQIEAYEKKKHTHQCARLGDVKKIYNFLRASGIRVNSVLCHGVRSGKELGYWLACDPKNIHVIGTEIGIRQNGSGIIKHDFNLPLTHHAAFDVVYSNSFDHAFLPQETFAIWLGQVYSGGALVIEHNGCCEKANSVDCAGFTFNDFEKLAKKHNLYISCVKLKATDRQKYRYAVVFSQRSLHDNNRTRVS